MRNCVHMHMDDTRLPSVRICTDFDDPHSPYSAYVVKVRSLRPFGMIIYKGMKKKCCFPPAGQLEVLGPN